jgi:hypothetical protein
VFRIGVRRNIWKNRVESGILFFVAENRVRICRNQGIEYFE